MSCKKCEPRKYPCNRPCNRPCNKPCNKPCNNECEVAYYEVNKCNNHRNCKCEIEKTEGLIEAIECKAEKIGCDLETAQENLGQVNPRLADITTKVARLGKDLGDIAKALEDAKGVLGDIVTDLGTVIPDQKVATNAVNDAIANQEALEDLIDCLEHAFKKTVCCLKKDNGGFPILIPIEKNNCGHGKHCGCDCDWD